MERLNQMPVLKMITDLEFFRASAVLVLVAFVTTWFCKRIVFRKAINNIQEKCVLITGCDSGFGKAAAIELDKIGFRVFATCLTTKGQEELRSVCSDKLKTIILDVTRSNDVQCALQEVKKFLLPGKGLWGLVNNAGIAMIGPIEWVGLEDYKKVADVNLWGVVDVTKTFLPLVKKEKGRIVNISSIGGRFCLPHASAYSISKFGVEAFSDALRREMSSTGVSVSIVEPGFFRTQLTDKENLKKLWQTAWCNLSPDMQEEYGHNFLQTSLHNMLKGMVDTCASPDIYKVVDVIKHALTSSSPKTRYIVGWDANFFWIWLSWVPAQIGDAILSMLGEETRPQLPNKPVKRLKDVNMNGLMKK